MTDARIKFKASMNNTYLNTFTIINEKISQGLFSLIFQGNIGYSRIMYNRDKKSKIGINFSAPKNFENKYAKIK